MSQSSSGLMSNKYTVGHDTELSIFITGVIPPEQAGRNTPTSEDKSDQTNSDTPPDKDTEQNNSE